MVKQRGALSLSTSRCMVVSSSSVIRRGVVAGRITAAYGHSICSRLEEAKHQMILVAMKRPASLRQNPVDHYITRVPVSVSCSITRACYCVQRTSLQIHTVQ